MSRYCVDTSAYSRFKKGDAAVIELLDTAEWIGVPSVVVGELWAGFLLGDRFERNITELGLFLSHSVVHEIPVTRETARLYAEILVALRRSGTPVPTNDIWIAAAAAQAGLTVITYDGHFRKIGRIGAIILSDSP